MPPMATIPAGAFAALFALASIPNWDRALAAEPTRTPASVPVLDHMVISQPVLADAGLAWGFCIGQSATLARIAQIGPSWSAEVAEANLAFRGFARPCDDLDAFMRQAMPTNLYETSRSQIEQSALAAQGAVISTDSAAAFIDTVGNRGRGDIPSPILETLLAIRYRTQPAREFADGFVSRYSTKGEAKARGLEVEMRLPASWASAPGELPNIVRKWTIQNGRGYSSINIGVRSFEGLSPTEADIADLLREIQADEALSNDAGSPRTTPITIGKRQGYRTRQRQTIARLDQQVVLDVETWNLFVGENLLVLSCLTPISPGVPTHEFDQDIRPLCNLVANSIVLPNDWR